MALKIKETSRADGEGFQIEQLLHGPFCSLDADCLLTLIAPAGNDPRRCRAGRAGMGADQLARYGASGCRRRFPIGQGGAAAGMADGTALAFTSACGGRTPDFYVAADYGPARSGETRLRIQMPAASGWRPAKSALRHPLPAMPPTSRQPAVSLRTVPAMTAGSRIDQGKRPTPIRRPDDGSAPPKGWRVILTMV